MTEGMTEEKLNLDLGTILDVSQLEGVEESVNVDLTTCIEWFGKMSFNTGRALRA